MTQPLYQAVAQQINIAALVKDVAVIKLDEGYLSSKEDGKYPEAEEIIRQVDHYFSAENLKDDKFLLEKLRGHENNAIELSIIHGFKKMRGYQPESAVIEAIKHCKLVDIFEEEGEWLIKRKEPYIIVDPTTGASVTKKKSKPKPTGFEEYYADPPITPEVFSQEQALYNQDFPFAQRIETALQRYAKKRRFTPGPANLFHRWMRYGGVESGQKMFTGKLDKGDFEDMDKDEIIAATATDFVGEDKFDESAEAKWTVDFEGVAKGFLSSEIPECFDFETLPEIRQCTNVMRNFYNYILHHSVCPEYNDSILAARHICDLADRELYQTHTVLRLLPGKFNIACSTIFGGRYKGTYVEDATWLGADEAGLVVGLGLDDAIKIFKYGVAALGSDDDFISGDADTVQRKILNYTIVEMQHNVGLNVVEIVPADPDHVALHNTKRGLGKGQALGKLICRPYTIPSFDITDLPPNYIDSSAAEKAETIFEFWLEQHILDSSFVGMKIEASVATLSNGLQFLDHVVAVRCSFYTLLYNDFLLLTKWKEPEEITREQAMQRKKEKEEWEEQMRVGREEGGQKISMPKPEVEVVKVDVGEKREDGMKDLVEEDVD